MVLVSGWRASLTEIPSDNADLGFQAVGLAMRIMQLNVEGLSADAYEKKKNRDQRRSSALEMCSQWCTHLLYLRFEKFAF